MSATSVARRRPPVAALAGVLLVVGVLGLVFWKIESGSEGLPYAHDASPPSTVQVTRNHDYQLAVPGGVDAMRKANVPVTQVGGTTVLSLHCTYTPPTGSTRTLSVTAEATDTKAENTVGQFIAPVDGSIHVDCDGWGAMFVPDADNRPFDTAGFALLTGTIALTLGIGLALSVAYRGWQERRPVDTDE